MLWKADENHIYTTDRFENEKMTVSLATLNTGIFIVPLSQSGDHMVCPEVTFRSLTGCYSCQLGAILKLEVRSTCDEGLAWIESAVLTKKGDAPLLLGFFATAEVQTMEFRVFYDEPTMLDIFTVYPAVTGQSVPRTFVVQSSLSVPTPEISLPDSSLEGLNETEKATETARREEVMYRIERGANWTVNEVNRRAQMAVENRKAVLSIIIGVLSVAIVYVITTKGGKKESKVEVKIWMKMLTKDEYVALSPQEQKSYLEHHAKEK
jgi:hypothetical protein